MQILGVRNPATPAAQTGAAGRYGAVAIDSEGKQIQSGTGGPDQTGRAMVATAAQTDVLALAAPGTGLRWYITGIAVAGTGAAGVPAMIKSAAVAIWRQHPGMAMSFPTPLQFGVNEAINVSLDSGSANVWVSLIGYKGV
jgi:hypothetical protein